MDALFAAVKPPLGGGAAAVTARTLPSKRAAAPAGDDAGAEARALLAPPAVKRQRAGAALESLQQLSQLSLDEGSPRATAGDAAAGTSPASAAPSPPHDHHARRWADFVVDCADAADCVAGFLCAADVGALARVCRGWRDAAPRLALNLRALRFADVRRCGLLPRDPAAMRRVDRLDMQDYVALASPARPGSQGGGGSGGGGGGGGARGGALPPSTPGDGAGVPAAEPLPPVTVDGWLRGLADSPRFATRLRVLVLAPQLRGSLAVLLLQRATGVAALSLGGMEAADDALLAAGLPTPRPALTRLNLSWAWRVTHDGVLRVMRHSPGVQAAWLVGVRGVCDATLREAPTLWPLLQSLALTPSRSSPSAVTAGGLAALLLAAPQLRTLQLLDGLTADPEAWGALLLAAARGARLPATGAGSDAVRVLALHGECAGLSEGVVWAALKALKALGEGEGEGGVGGRGSLVARRRFHLVVDDACSLKPSVELAEALRRAAA